MSDVDISPPFTRKWKDIGIKLSNFDFKIEDGTEDELRAGNVYCGYSAWDFFGDVWFEDGMFHCYVMIYGGHVDTISAGSLHELMELCSDAYGYK